MIDGEGDPASAAAYVDAVETLYAVAFAVRFDLKRRAGIDAKVMPLEGIWWSDTAGDVWASRDAWRWTMLIAEPDAVTEHVLARALSVAARTRPRARLQRLRHGRLSEGRVAQVLHIGPYGEAERPTIELLHAHIADQGLRGRGKHHEIYLNDARRTDPSRLRTIIRQPVAG